MTQSIMVAQLKDIPPGGTLSIQIKERDIALFNIDGKIFATINACPHHGGPLSDGVLEGNIVACPWHGWRLDVTSGAIEVNPNEKIETFDVKTEGNDIFVTL